VCQHFALATSGGGNMRVAAVIAVVGAVLVGGCSDDESSSPAGDPPTTEVAGADQQFADDAVWVASDLPDGWTATDGGIENRETTIEECEAEDPNSVSDDGDARSVSAWVAPSGQRGYVDSKVEINPDEAQAEAVMAALRTPAGKECLTAALATALAQPGQEVGDVELVERDSEGYGDDSITFRAAVPLSGEGYDFIWFADLVTIRDGRALVDMAFGSQDEPIAAAEQQRLTDIVLERIPADL
jgi:hypothetical protein